MTENLKLQLVTTWTGSMIDADARVTDVQASTWQEWLPSCKSSRIDCLVEVLYKIVKQLSPTLFRLL